MSDDWIKMRTDMYRDPKVIMIADFLMYRDKQLHSYVDQNMQNEMCVTRNVMRNVTVGALVSVWGVLRHRGSRIDDDLVIRNGTIDLVDDVADLQGFGAAMESVEWVIQTEAGIVFPNYFSDFNSDPRDDQKQKNAQRQRRYREKQKAKSDETSNGDSDVTVTDKNNVEKRREEKSIYTANFEDFWLSYPRKDNKAAALKAFEKLNPDEVLTARIKSNIRQRLDSGDWSLTDKKHIPHGSTYLNGSRWEDEILSSTPTNPEGFIK